MTKDEAAIEALICTELANPEQYLALSVTLPFKKCLDRKSMKTLRKALRTTNHPGFNARLNVLVQEHRIVAAAALRRTAQTSEWFSATRELDVECHTQPGTLNYLPPELRDQVWTYVVEDDKTCNYSANGNLLDKVTYGNFDLLGPVKVDPIYFVRIGTHICYHGDYAPTIGAQCQTHCIHASTVCHLQDASETVGLEIDPIFFSRSNFYFEDPRALVRFLARLQHLVLLKPTATTTATPNHGLRFHFNFFRTNVAGTDCERLSEDWLRAFERLPRTCRSVEYFVGRKHTNWAKESDCRVCELWRTTFLRRVEEALDRRRRLREWMAESAR
jgi:hypothetical protein